jgi:hypothetical protein
VDFLTKLSSLLKIPTKFIPNFHKFHPPPNHSPPKTSRFLGFPTATPQLSLSFNRKQSCFPAKLSLYPSVFVVSVFRLINFLEAFSSLRTGDVKKKGLKALRKLKNMYTEASRIFPLLIYNFY